MSDAQEINLGNIHASSSVVEEGGIYLVLFSDCNEFNVALRKAASFAQSNGAHIGILYVIEEQDFQHWGGIEERMKEDQRAQAEQALQDIAVFLKDYNTLPPAFYIEEGKRRDVIMDVISSDPNIKMMVLGASSGAANPMVNYFIEGGGLHDSKVPLLVVPDLPENS